jgi:hypothetical protein
VPTPTITTGIEVVALRRARVGRNALGQDQVGAPGDELGCKSRQTLVGAFCHGRLEKNEISAFGPTELFQLGSKLAEQSVDRGTVESREIADAARPGLACGALAE